MAVLTKWIFKPGLIQGIKAPFYGAPYSAQVSLTFVNGECHVTNMLARADGVIDRADIREIEDHILLCGYTQYTEIRYKNGEPVKRVKTIRR